MSILVSTLVVTCRVPDDGADDARRVDAAAREGAEHQVSDGDGEADGNLPTVADGKRELV